MKALDLNYARDASGARSIGKFLFAVAVLAVAVLGYVYLASSSELDSWRGKRDALKRSQEKSDVSPAKLGRNTPEWQKRQAELKEANRVIDRLSMPWGLLFREIEGLASDEVTLLGIEPDTDKGEIRLIAEAKDFSAMLGYLKRMQGVPLFADPHIVTHQIQQQDPQRPVRFTVSAGWVAPVQKTEKVEKVKSLPAESAVSTSPELERPD